MAKSKKKDNNGKVTMIRQNTISKKERQKRIREQNASMEVAEMKRKKTTNRTCIQCGLNPAWLDYPICYQCYTKKEKEQKERTHYMGGYNPL